MITAEMVCKIMAVFPAQLPAMEKWQWMADQLNDALLRERESAKAAVTDEMVDIALTTMYGEQFADISGKAEEIFRQHMRAALEAVAPMLASARVPDGLRPVTLAVIGRKHFGNPIPKEWYAAARDLLAAAAPKPKTEE